jgi:signal transduction histidine kinase
MWVGSAADGLFRYRDGRFETFGPEQGLGDRLVAVILEDEDANLWVSTARGISRLERDRIEAVAEGRAARLDPILIDRQDGMRNPEGSGGGFDPSGLRDRHGRLWISTIGGIAMIDPRTFPVNRVVPSVLVEGATIDERPAAVGPDGALEVPAGATSLEIAYTSFSLMAPSKNRFRYRLAGLDKDWHDAGARRVAYYTRLPPGEYRFEVLASNNDGVWAEAPATLDVVAQPFFWERRPVQLAALALLLAATGMTVYLVQQRRARRRLADLEREQAVERERTRIARDLHDDLGSRLTHIALIAEDEQSPERVAGAARAAAEVLDELVWSVNARHDTLEGFASYASRLAEEHVAAAGLRLRVSLSPDLDGRELRADVRRHLYLAFKEAVSNALKHARATEIRVRIATEGHSLLLDVADDGRGMEHPGDPTGNGLANVCERLRQVGGRAEWLPRETGGTLVRMRAPLPARGGE